MIETDATATPAMQNALADALALNPRQRRAVEDFLRATRNLDIEIDPDSVRNAKPETLLRILKMDAQP